MTGSRGQVTAIVTESAGMPKFTENAEPVWHEAQ
jgi:hypothetical protein